jgi:hypothetical protein
MFDGLRLATLDEVGNAEFGDCANRAAEGGAVENASELFRFLLGHDFHLECCRTLSRGKAESQEFSCREKKTSQYDDVSVVSGLALFGASQERTEYAAHNLSAD